VRGCASSNVDDLSLPYLHFFNIYIMIFILGFFTEHPSADMPLETTN